MEHPEIWYPVNAFGGRWLLGIGAAIVLAALALKHFIPNLPLDIYAYCVLGVMVVLFTIAIVAIVKYMNSI